MTTASASVSKKKIPLEACRLRGADFAQFELLAEDPAAPEVKRQWSMLAHTGRVVQRWWGNLVLDLDGAKFQQRLALLMDHDTSQRIGFSASVTRTERGLEAKGSLLGNEIADQVLKDSSAGFPFQASLMAVPSRLEEVQPGMEATVNGKTVVGPATIFREWTVRELTLTVLGADQDTTTEVFAGDGELEVEVLTMTTKLKEPAQDPATPSQVLATPPAAPAPSGTQAPAAAVLAPEADAERKRVSAILATASSTQQKLAKQLIDDGTELSAALAKLAADANEQLSAAQSRLRSDGTDPVGAGNSAGSDGANRVPAQLRSDRLPTEAERTEMFRASPGLRQEFTMHGESEEIGLRRFLAYGRFASKHLKGAELAQAFTIGEKLAAAETHLAPLTARGIRGDFYLGLETRDNTWLTDIATVYDTDSPQEDYPFLGVVPKFGKWEGPRKEQQANRGKLTIVNDDYEMTLAIAGKDWRRDKSGQISLLVQESGDAAAETPIDLISALLNTGSTTSLAWDGVALFGTHVWGKSGNIVNNLTTSDSLAGGAAPSTAQMITNIWICIKRMLAFKDDQGRAMNQRAKSFKIMIPVNMIDAVESALKEMFSSSGVSNTLAGALSRGKFKIDYVVNAGLTAPDTFFMWRDDARVKPFVYQEEFVKAPYVLAEGSEHYLTTNNVQIGGHLAGAAAPGKYELIVRAKCA